MLITVPVIHVSNLDLTKLHQASRKQAFLKINIEGIRDTYFLELKFGGDKDTAIKKAKNYAKRHCKRHQDICEGEQCSSRLDCISDSDIEKIVSEKDMQQVG